MKRDRRRLLNVFIKTYFCHNWLRFDSLLFLQPFLRHLFCSFAGVHTDHFCHQYISLGYRRVSNICWTHAKAKNRQSSVASIPVRSFLPFNSVQNEWIKNLISIYTWLKCAQDESERSRARCRRCLLFNALSVLMVWWEMTRLNHFCCLIGRKVKKLKYILSAVSPSECHKQKRIIY